MMNSLTKAQMKKTPIWSLKTTRVPPKKIRREESETRIRVRYFSSHQIPLDRLVPLFGAEYPLWHVSYLTLIIENQADVSEEEKEEPKQEPVQKKQTPKANNSTKKEQKQSKEENIVVEKSQKAESQPQGKKNKKKNKKSTNENKVDDSKATKDDEDKPEEVSIRLHYLIP